MKNSDLSWLARDVAGEDIFEDLQVGDPGENVMQSLEFETLAS
jgi:hypothetical protein